MTSPPPYILPWQSYWKKEKLFRIIATYVSQAWHRHVENGRLKELSKEIWYINYCPLWEIILGFLAQVFPKAPSNVESTDIFHNTHGKTSTIYTYYPWNSCILHYFWVAPNILISLINKEMDWKVFVKCYGNITFVLRMFEFAFIINKSKNWTENISTPIRIIMSKESEVM